MKSNAVIPKIIHQTWKTSRIPKKWLVFQDKVKALHPDWVYLLWTNADMDRFVKREYPQFYDVFINFERNIMRADVFRYLVLHRMGGMYLDLDYEFLRPFDFQQQSLVLPLNRSKAFGDPKDSLGNAIMASVPDHPFWKKVIAELQNNPPKTSTYKEVVAATGPEFLTRIYTNSQQQQICTPPRSFFHCPMPKRKQEYNLLVKNKEVYGLHYCWGSWKERLSWAYWKSKFIKITIGQPI